MAPSLRILAGSSASTLQPVAVNHDTQPSIIDADNFKGRIAVRIKGFNGEVPEGVEKKHEAEYFEDGNGKGMSWSMQIQGECGVRGTGCVVGCGLWSLDRLGYEYGCILGFVLGSIALGMFVKGREGRSAKMIRSVRSPDQTYPAGREGSYF